MNRGSRSQGGYTIVETLIFLAVSGFMFLIAMNTFSRQQARNEYITAVRDFKVRVDGVINDVASGNYDYPTGYQCTALASSPPSVISASPAEQGTNKGCIFVGKVLKVGASSGSASPDEQFAVYGLVGRQFAPNSTVEPAANLDDARPVLLASGTTQQTGFPNTVHTVGAIGGGVRAVKLRSGTSSWDLNQQSVIGFFNSVDQLANGTAGGNGAMRVDLGVPLDTNTCFANTDDDTSAEFVDAYRSCLGGVASQFDINPVDGTGRAKGVGICLEASRVNNHAWIDIGKGDSGALTTTIEYGEGPCL